jgi:BirA family biotin operon repressor/biotin-[acetyl-CoA-carboxylase] ligase
VGAKRVKLAEVALRKCFRQICLDEVVSTNDEALVLAKAGDEGHLWIVARAQTGGRGRHGRIWNSPPGNLYASLLLVDPSPLSKAPQLGFVAGVALARSLRTLLDGDDRLCLKWPNDILHDGAKLAGILLESIVLTQGHVACVIGIGVNCATHPQGLTYPATDLATLGATQALPEDVFLRLSGEIAEQLVLWDEGRSFESIRSEWLGLAGGLGTRIKVVQPRGEREGLFRTIDSEGRLILETSEGLHAIEAGEVFLQPRPKGSLAAL